MNKSYSATVAFKTLAAGCHMLDLRQKVRHIVAHSQASDGYIGRTPFSDETFETKLAV